MKITEALDYRAFGTVNKISMQTRSTRINMLLSAKREIHAHCAHTYDERALRQEGEKKEINSMCKTVLYSALLTLSFAYPAAFLYTQ